MSAQLLFVLIFLSQIICVSILLPARLVRQAGLRSDERGIAHISRRPVSAYRLANGTAALIGCSLLCTIIISGLFERVTPTLALIGLSFVCQLLPLLLIRSEWLSDETAKTDTMIDESTIRRYRSLKLLEVISPAAFGVAVMLFLLYMGFQLSGRGSGESIHIAKIIIFTATNLLFAGAVAISFLSLRKADDADLRTQYRSVIAGVNLMVFASIMISIYWFSKEALFAFNLHQFRPAMMSAFLHLPALALFKTLSLSREVRTG